MTLAIETHALTRCYGRLHAVDELSLCVTQGEIYAFLGLNGAGKTTTLRMLLGMIRPSAGTASVLGQTVQLGSRRPWAQVGYLVETARAYPELTVRENLEVARRLHPGTPALAIDQVIDRLSLGPYAQRRAGQLSLGNLQRLGLARALLHHPRLLLLDEPANGLDPAGIVEIRQLLRELSHQEGVTVFMSSHILAEVARLADRIGVIDRGRLIRELDRDGLEAERQRRLLVRTHQNALAVPALAAAGHPALALDGDELQLLDPVALAQPERIAQCLVQAGAPPTQLLLEEEDLEQYFLRLVRPQRAVPHA
jgi:ABC-2 type transport system ATP-binding protein